MLSNERASKYVHMVNTELYTYFCLCMALWVVQMTGPFKGSLVSWSSKCMQLIWLRKERTNIFG